jgi:polyhydroxyalkanoate synthesis regulator phasin
MAKKDKKKNKQKGSDAAEAVEAVRSAVERTFQATSEGAGATQKRTRALVDEIAHAAARVRETIEDLRVLEDVRGLRAEVEALARRVTALENRNAAPSRPAPAKRSTAKPKPAAKTSAKTRAKAKSKPRAKRAAAGRS